MIDLFTIFNTGGIVLWQKSFHPTSDRIPNSLVSDIFIENRTNEETLYHKDNYTVRYSVVNELGLIFVSVYQSILQLTYVDELIANIKTIFLSLFKDQLLEIKASGEAFPQHLDFEKFNSYFNLRLGELDGASSAKLPESPEHIESPIDSEASTPIDTPNRSENSSPVSKAEHKKTRRGGRSKNKPTSLLEESKKKAAKKQLRKWGADGMAEVDTNEVLDYSNANDSDNTQSFDESNEAVGDLQNYGSSTKNGDFMLKELSSELTAILGDKQSSETSQSSGGAFSFLRNIVGGKTMTEDVLKQTLTAMQDHLMKKNVAREVAEHLCNTVEKSLVGSKTQNWTSVEATVRASMTEALRRILTPNTSADLLLEIHNKLKANFTQTLGLSTSTSPRPYVISVVGVNGVGKSTNLSKIAFWLLQNKFRVLIAACDTFRSGAVEQLKVHVHRLQELTARLGVGDVQIFDEGYGKDAAVIAQKAIEYGQRNKFDIVLIDTAGRRHNDERLMSSLEKFGKLANPDKIVMVGEALVGTDSVQQARNFNASFGPNRNLDFFLISKCDTVGDMIGSMVNMTYSTGIPVLFVGIGQTYTDLRTLSVDWAVNLLMS